MKTKYFLIFPVLLLSCLFCKDLSAQRCLVFYYDSDGNRVQRFVTDNCEDNREYDEIQEFEIDKDENLTVYPNPTKGTFIITLPDNDISLSSTCVLYGINGVKLFECNICGKETIDISEFPSGVYLLRVTNEVEVYTDVILKY